MATLETWMQDVMSQKFLSSDITRLIMIYGLTSSGTFDRVTSKTKMVEYIYRVYSDYQDAATANPDIRVKNIKYYGVADIRHVLDIALSEWKSFAPNCVLQYDERYIYINLDEQFLISSVKPTRMVIDMFLKKYFAFSFSDPKELNIDECKNDTNINTFGTGIFRNRVFEDIQFCPLCEETKLSELVAVHILPAEHCLNEEQLTDKNNGMIFCKEHAQKYLQHKFIFKENGFVKILEPCGLNDKMHLGVYVKNQKRREYINRVYEIYSR